MPLCRNQICDSFRAHRESRQAGPRAPAGPGWKRTPSNRARPLWVATQDSHWRLCHSADAVVGPNHPQPATRRATREFVAPSRGEEVSIKAAPNLGAIELLRSVTIW